MRGKRQPVFRYKYGSIEIDDFPQPQPGDLDPSLKRTFTLKLRGLTPSGSPPALLFLVATATKEIKPLKNGWYQIDDRMRIRVRGAKGDKPIIRKSGGRWELLFPVTFQGNTATLTQECEW